MRIWTNFEVRNLNREATKNRTILKIIIALTVNGVSYSGVGKNKKAACYAAGNDALMIQARSLPRHKRRSSLPSRPRRSPQSGQSSAKGATRDERIQYNVCKGPAIKREPVDLLFAVY